MSTRTQLIKRSLTLLSLLAIAWLLWSGLFKSHLLGLGVFSCLLTLYVSHRMGYLKTELFALRFSRRLLRYWLWLAKEIVKSSIDVARVVIDPRLPISPQVVKIKASSVHPVDLTILANSITLTPGTLALDVHNGEITVHTLTKAGAEDLVMGEMDRRVAALRDH